MIPLAIRPERPLDPPRVFAIHRAAFGRDAEAELVDALRESERPLVSLVAEADDVPVGHVMVSPVSLHPAPGAPVEGPLLALAPVGVTPAWQGRGVGGALCRAALDACGELGAPLVFVLGHPSYYRRFGFEPAGPHGFTYRGADPGPAFMVCALRRDATAGLSGDVRYAAAFDALGTGR